MKRFLFAAAALTAAMMSSCNSDDSNFPTIDPEYAVLDFESAPVYASDIAGGNCYSYYTGDAANLYTTYTDTKTGLTMWLNVDEGQSWSTNKPEFSAGGIVPSKFNDMVTPSYPNQCSVYDAKGGHSGSKSFGSVYAPSWNNGTAKLKFDDGVERTASQMWVTNATYTVLEYDTEKLTSGEVWLKMTVTGYDKTGAKTNTAEKYLVDYRKDTANKGMLKQWTPVDLTALGKVNRLEIAVTSNDPMYPNYVCIDDVTFLL